MLLNISFVAEFLLCNYLLVDMFSIFTVCIVSINYHGMFCICTDRFYSSLTFSACTICPCTMSPMWGTVTARVFERAQFICRSEIIRIDRMSIYEGHSINQLQNGIILLIFKI